MSSIIKVNTVQDQDGNNIINGASGDTIKIPSGATLDIVSGATLANNGTATGFASIDWQSSIVTAATLTAVAGRGYWIDTSSNACTITLPGSASVGDQIIFTDYARNWATNAVTLNQNSLKFQGNTSPNPVYNTNGQSVDIVYSGATKGWIPNSDDDVTFETPQSYSAEYLVVAGGGSGGKANAGGAGAGGLLTNFGGAAITLNGGTVYTITVGSGGAGQTSSSNRGNSGNNSVISGTGLTTITSIGGGGGGGGTTAPNGNGGDGGSGGGSGYASGRTGGSGTSGQGNDGGSGGSGAPAYGAAAGGGAGAAGEDAGSDRGGNGGNGLANSITGSSVTYAGGGGGSVDGNQTVGSGGSGGGGAGGQGSGTTAVSGTANTGGGGGGAHANTSGAGGSGVVILSVPDASYSGTTTGSPTVATGVSGKTVITFTGSGSYTA